MHAVKPCHISREVRRTFNFFRKSAAMKIRPGYLAAGLLAAPAAAHADVNGFYVSLNAGANLVTPTRELKALSGTFTPDPGFPINVGTTPGAPFYRRVGPTYYDNGPVVIAAVGYGFSNGIRAELEGSFSTNPVNRLNHGLLNGLGTDPLGLAYTGNEKKYTVMANVLYDFNSLARDWGFPITPYIGVGAGVTIVDWGGVTRNGAGEDFTGAGLGVVQTITNAFHTTDRTLALQAMAGFSYDVPGVPGLALTTDARVVALPQGFAQSSVITLNFRPVPAPAFPTLVGPNAGSKWGNEINYRFTVGLRYSFNAAPPPAPAAVPVAMADSRSFLVFFDWDKANLTDRARAIVAEAAMASTKARSTRVAVDGNTDTSGTAQYNQGLSIRRAETVAAELVRNGVPRTAIYVQGFGETRPLVPAGPDVREPRNRRVDIVLR